MDTIMASNQANVNVNVVFQVDHVIFFFRILKSNHPRTSSAPPLHKIVRDKLCHSATLPSINDVFIPLLL